MQPTISIILPTYNGSKYIRTSIDSCLQQTFADFELIIVNDCSTDETASIIETYAASDKRIKIIHNEHNKKLPLSLNAGFDAAQGKYFTWTSDDNYYAPEALQTMLKEFENDHTTDLVYCDYTLIDDSGKIFGTRTFNNIYISFFNWQGCGACFLYKAEIHKTLNGYNPSAFLIEDYEFFIRAFLKYQFTYLPVTDLYFYREHPDSLTSTQSTTVKDISKIFLERQIPGLAQKLSSVEVALLYRKFAVYYAVQKNDAAKYNEYLMKLSAISKQQAFITIFYVPVLKTFLTVKVTLNGWLTFLRSLINTK
jgi:glycosyltransferase involved in cell wall biosynthesis